MNRLRVALAALMSTLPLTTFAQATGAADMQKPTAATTQQLAGVYALRGVREMAAEIRLLPDGRFKYGMVYGGLDVAVEGRWTVDGSRLTLRADPLPLPSLTLGRVEPTLIGGYADDRQTRALLVVKVVVPRLAAVWSGMEVTAEFSNGMKRSGVTGRDGLLGFAQRDEEPWRGAVIKRISVGNPRGGLALVPFDIEPASTRTIVLDFEPGEFGPPPPFELLVMDVRKGEAGEPTLVQVSESTGRPGLTFFRR